MSTLRPCPRCRRHVIGRTCPFCTARHAVVAGVIVAAACGGRTTLGEVIRVSVDASPDTSQPDMPDSAFTVPDAAVTDSAGKDTSIIPIYGAPPLPQDS